VSALAPGGCANSINAALSMPGGGVCKPGEDEKREEEAEPCCADER
jgi:hypothetical protein